MKDDDEGAKIGIILVEQSGLSLLQTFLWYKIFAKHLLLHNILGSIRIRSISLSSTLVALQRREIRYVFSSATHFFELKWGGLAGHAHWFAGNAKGELFAIPSDPTEEKCAIRLPRKSSELFLEIMKVEHGD